MIMGVNQERKQWTSRTDVTFSFGPFHEIGQKSENFFA